MMVSWRWEIEVKYSEKCFLRVSSQKPCFRGGQGCSSGSELGSVRASHMVSILNMWRGYGEQLRFGAVWQGWSPWKEPMRSCGWKCNPVAAEDPSILEMPVCVMNWPLRWSAAVEQRQPEPSVSLCGARERSQRSDPSPLSGKAQKVMSESQTVDTALFTLLGIWFCFDLIVTVPLFSPLE